MIMRLTDIGSQYLIDFVDSEGEYFDGSKTYKVTLPANIPAGKFWSFTVYDSQTRSLFLRPTRIRSTPSAFPISPRGPWCWEVPPKFLGAIDDYWFRWVTDIGAPGADRGEDGKYLILPPGYDGSMPEGGFYVARARTTRVVWFGRVFLENKSDPSRRPNRSILTTSAPRSASW
jgi:hypothetical protein